MLNRKYLFLQRSQSGHQRQQPSPAQMQEMYAAFNAWKEKFKENILDMGGKQAAHWTRLSVIGSERMRFDRS